MLPSLSGLKAIFFDLDNVLVFSELTHFKAWQKVMPQFSVDPEQLHYQSMMGVSDLKLAHLFQHQFKIDATPEVIWKTKLQAYLDLLTTEKLESPIGRNAFLEKVTQLYTIGLVSSSNSEPIHRILQTENMATHFDFIIGHEDCLKHKPDPTPYQKALSLAQVESHEALVIEDSVAGITAAQAAGIPVVGIYKDQSPEQLIKGVTYFNDFEEIHRSLFPHTLSCEEPLKQNIIIQKP